ncbi:MAG TPA: trypsin-like peptidase domain-containing protein [Pirellulaceae bacterium]|nr:trypsin-like peptidase domain-containing protein [Pirellulaceae bacterium]
MPDSCVLPPLWRRWTAGLLLAGFAPWVLCCTAAHASDLRNGPIVKAVREARPSIVNIHGRKTIKSDGATYGVSDGVKQVNGMGTGIIFDDRGYILTNYHVVEGVATIQVSTHDEKTTVAKIVAHDPKTDLAIIRIESEKPLRPILFGTSDDLMEGEPVIAVGNAFGYEHTVTRGIISALHRTVQVSDDQKYHDLIQTDASINPGNSGGPLLNIDGEVIGINVAVRVGAQGIGFAIPIDEALEVASRLMSVERLEKNTHGIVGSTSIENEHRVFKVQGVKEGTPADKAGLKKGDVITSIGQRKIERALDVELALFGMKAGEEIDCKVLRDGTPADCKLALKSVKGTTKPVLADRVWSVLGLKLSPMEDTDFKALGTRYRGGLKVLEVRRNSPAYLQGIRAGDVLVGVHVWETISLDNMAYILDRDDLAKSEPVIFYIVRGTDTLYGHLRMAERTTP